MNQVAQKLCRTGEILAADRRIVPITGNGLPAGGTAVREMINRVSAVPGHREHLRDNLPGLAHPNDVSDGDLLFIDKILIVKHRAGNGRSGEADRLKNRRGGQGAGAPTFTSTARRVVSFSSGGYL